MTLRIKPRHIRFPVVSGNTNAFPSAKPMRCPICGKRRIGEPHSFVCFSGGAIQMYTGDSGGPSSDMRGILNLDWHGAHTDHGGVGALPDTFETVEVVRDVVGGQFELYFCSIRCFRRFTKSIADELESKLKKQRRKKPRRV